MTDFLLRVSVLFTVFLPALFFFITVTAFLPVPLRAGWSVNVGRNDSIWRGILTPVGVLSMIVVRAESPRSIGYARWAELEPKPA